MAKILCVLYDDPVDGYPILMRAPICPKSIVIRVARHCRRLKAIDFKPGALLGSASGELGLRKYLAF